MKSFALTLPILFLVLGLCSPGVGEEQPVYVNGLDKSGNPEGFKVLALGDKAPDFSLLGIDGKTHS